MTIKPRENVQNFSQQKKLFAFNEKNGKLRERAEKKLLQVSNVQRNLWKTLRHAASHHQLLGDYSQYVDVNPKLETKCKYSTKETESDTRHVNEVNNSDGSNGHLLILAHSAELMRASDSFNGLHGNDSSNEVAQNSSENASHAIVTDHTSPGKQIEELSVIDQMRNGEDGFHGEVRTQRLSQIRRQARLQSNLFRDSTVGNLQGMGARVTQIRNQARSKNHLQKCSSEGSQGRIVRLSQMRRQARIKNNSLVQKASENLVNQHLDCQTFKDRQRERIIADIFGEEDGSRADCHLLETDSMHELNVNAGMSQSVSVINEIQDKEFMVKSTKQLVT